MLRRTAECLWVRPPPPFPVPFRLTCSFEQIVQHPHIARRVDAPKMHGGHGASLEIVHPDTL